MPEETTQYSGEIGFVFLFFGLSLLRLVWWKLFVYPLALLLFYPVVPLVLTIAYLITDNEKTLEKAVMSKYFTAFLDHGPQFVLRLVIVVLVGVSQNGVYSR